MRALLVNADCVPIRVISWERAISMILDKKAEVLEHYSGHFIRSVNQIFDFPAVVRLLKYRKPRVRVRFNRFNLLVRDNYTCAYCGCRPWKVTRPDYEMLTLDHVVPRSKGGKTTWVNIVTACVDCNRKKADKLLKDTKLRLRFEPRSPTALDVLHMSITRCDIQKEWIDYLPEQAKEWANYWTVELEP